MKTFKDDTGQEWTVKIDIGAVKRLRDLAGIDIHGKNAAPDALLKIANDEILLGEALFAVCHAQAKERGLDINDFFANMSGDSILEATNAFMEEFADYSPLPSRRRLMHKALAAAKTVDEKALALIDKKLDEAIAQMDGEPFTSSPESAESTQTP